MFFLPSSGRMTFFSLAMIVALHWWTAAEALRAPEAVGYV